MSVPHGHGVDRRRVLRPRLDWECEQSVVLFAESGVLRSADGMAPRFTAGKKGRKTLNQQWINSSTPNPSTVINACVCVCVYLLVLSVSTCSSLL